MASVGTWEIIICTFIFIFLNLLFHCTWLPHMMQDEECRPLLASVEGPQEQHSFAAGPGFDIGCDCK